MGENYLEKIALLYVNFRSKSDRVTSQFWFVGEVGDWDFHWFVEREIGDCDF